MLWKRIVLGITLFLVLAVIGFVVWGSTPASAMDAAAEALKSDERVSTQVGNWLIFTPVNQKPRAGLIYYPGGRVDYRAYAPFARDVAAQGYLVVIPRMPFSLAVLSPNTAGDVIAAYPEIPAWALGGHSLGGAMAARYVYAHPNQARGLLLGAAYPVESDDLSQYDLLVTSVYGTHDGVAKPEEVRAATPLLPPGTRWVAIEGGNHAGFGWYGEQQGDGEPGISREEQQAQAVQAAVELLQQIEAR